MSKEAAEILAQAMRECFVTTLVDEGMTGEENIVDAIVYIAHDFKELAGRGRDNSVITEQGDRIATALEKIALGLESVTSQIPNDMS